MTEGTLAIRYARALMGLARQENSIEAFRAQLITFLDVCKMSDLLFSTLTNKGFSIVKRVSILDQVINKLNLNKFIVNFLKILIEKGRFEFLPVIVKTFSTMSDIELGRCPMTVTSAVSLPDEQYKNLTELFGKEYRQEMVLDKEIDPSVLGGVRVKIGNKIYDSTIKTQLLDLKRVAMGDRR